jgi:hypothetical protein
MQRLQLFLSLLNFQSPHCLSHPDVQHFVQIDLDCCNVAQLCSQHAPGVEEIHVTDKDKCAKGNHPCHILHFARDQIYVHAIMTEQPLYITA